MTGKPSLDRPPTDVFSVLSDPVRWSIIAQAAAVHLYRAVNDDGAQEAILTW